jgi:hypothetical protein
MNVLSKEMNVFDTNIHFGLYTTSPDQVSESVCLSGSPALSFCLSLPRRFFVAVRLPVPALHFVRGLWSLLLRPLLVRESAAVNAVNGLVTGLMP